MVRRLRKENRRGAALIEMAIVLLLLLMLTLGAIKYGWLFLKAQQITNATRQGARLAILPGVTPTEVTASIETMMAAAGMPEGSYSVYYEYGDLSGVGPDAQTITVRIIVPSANVDFLNIPLLPAPANLGAEVTMAVEGS